MLEDEGGVDVGVEVVLGAGDGVDEDAGAFEFDGGGLSSQAMAGAVGGDHEIEIEGLTRRLVFAGELIALKLLFGVGLGGVLEECGEVGRGGAFESRVDLVG